jgi:hypothetical protein
MRLLRGPPSDETHLSYDYLLLALLLFASVEHVLVLPPGPDLATSNSCAPRPTPHGEGRIGLADHVVLSAFARIRRAARGP